MRCIALLISTMATLVPAAASASETVTYGYDAKGRLVTVSHSGSVNNNLTATYKFDKADNRIAVAVTGPGHPGLTLLLAIPALLSRRR